MATALATGRLFFVYPTMIFTIAALFIGVSAQNSDLLVFFALWYY